MPLLVALDTVLQKQLLPHESADDREVYPALATLLGGDDPLAAMSHAHREIFRLHRLFSAAVSRLQAQTDDAANIVDAVDVAATLRELQRMLLPKDPDDQRPAFMEIRAGRRDLPECLG